MLSLDPTSMACSPDESVPSAPPVNFECLRPYAENNPAMPADRFAIFEADIVANGQVSPIVIWRDRVLDGWHRLRVCLENDITPLYEIFEGDEAAAQKREKSLNRNRRQLTKSQSACYRVRDQDRAQLAKRGGDRSAQGLASVVTTSQLAQETEASKSYIKMAFTLHKRCPDRFREVLLGQKTLNKAYSECCPKVRGDGSRTCECKANCSNQNCPHAQLHIALRAEIEGLKQQIAAMTGGTQRCDKQKISGNRDFPWRVDPAVSSGRTTDLPRRA